jgi:hypothetical protein
VISGVIDTADHKKSMRNWNISAITKFLCKKALTRRPGAQMMEFDEKNQRLKIS